MRQREGKTTTGRRALRWLAAACAVGALGGCGESSERSDDVPPLPRYWQGASYAPVGGLAATPAVDESRPYDASAAPPFGAIARAAVGDAEAALARLPEVAEPDAAVVDLTPQLAGASPPMCGMLLPPQAVGGEEPAPPEVVFADDAPMIWPPSPDDFAAADEPKHVAGTMPARTSVGPRGRHAADAAAPDGAHLAAGTPTGAVVNQRAAARLRRGNELAERGAYFAARNEFLAVLRLIAEAKDQLHGAARRTLALESGLRALAEAENFSPHAPGAGSGLNLAVIVAAHQTPAAKSMAIDELLPGQLAEAYFEYAQVQLAGAVAGEPAGSMALHALGKLESRLGRAEPYEHPQADRRAFALQRAALLARDDNDMAAHELGVLLAEAGHFGQSEALLRQVAARAPHPVVFRNLARVQRQQGRTDLAAASDRQAEYLASRGAGGKPTVEWVSATALARAPDPLGPGATPARTVASPPSPGPAPYRR